MNKTNNDTTDLLVYKNIKEGHEIKVIKEEANNENMDTNNDKIVIFSSENIFPPTIEEKKTTRSSLEIHNEILSESREEVRRELIFELINSFDENSENTDVMNIAKNLLGNINTRREIIGFLPSFLSPNEISSLYKDTYYYLNDEEKKMMLSSYLALSMINVQSLSEDPAIINDIKKYNLEKDVDRDRNILALSFTMIPDDEKDNYVDMHKSSKESLNKLGDLPIDKSIDEVYFWLEAQYKLYEDKNIIQKNYERLSLSQKVNLINFNPNIIDKLSHEKIIIELKKASKKAISSNDISELNKSIFGLKYLSSMYQNNDKYKHLINNAVYDVISTSTHNEAYEYFYNSYY